MQGVGQQQGDERGEQNAAGQYQNRDAEKVANQFIKRGQSQLADLFTLVPDGLHCGLRKQPFTDKAAHLFFVGQRFVAPCSEVLLLAVEHDGLGNLTLLPQRSEGLLCCRAVAKHQGSFEAAAHGRSSELKIFLRVLLEREDRGRAQQQPDQRHGDHHAYHANATQRAFERRARCL